MRLDLGLHALSLSLSRPGNVQIHLFDINMEPEQQGGVQFNESLALTAGSEPTVVQIGCHKVGVGICHDKRFDELARLYRNLGKSGGSCSLT